MSTSDLFDRVVCDRELSRLGKAMEEAPVDGKGRDHDRMVDISSPLVKINPPIHFIPLVETGGMIEKEWQNRPWFLQWVEDARAMLKASGGKGTYAEVALIMGLAANSMKKYTAEEWTGAKPGPKALRKLGDYLGRDYRVLFDGPAPAGFSFA